MNVQAANICIALGGKNILQKISLDVQDGEFLSLLGASGAGKSTLLKIIAGILYQDCGTVAFNGHIIDETPTHKRRCAMMFQDIRLFPHMNVRDNVAFPCKIARISRSERFQRAEELLEQVGLGGFGNRRPAELSGGQAQRVALARALASNPQALLLDEPFSGLDEQLRDDMRSLVLRLHRELAITTIMVTHDASEALMMSDRIAYMNQGEIKQIGTPEDLYHTPQALEVAQCFGDCSTLKGTVSQELFTSGDFEHPSPNTPDGPAYAVVRNLSTSLEVNEHGPLRVRCGVFSSSGYLARIDVAEQTLVIPVKKQLPEGTPVNVRVDNEGFFVYPCVS